MFHAIGLFHSARRLTAELLCILALLPTGSAQTTPEHVGAVTVKVVQGNDAYHSIGTRTGVMTIVEIRDETGRAIEGASVTFETPETGAGGIFSTGGRVFRTTTNSMGRAAATGFVPNASVGKFPVQVIVSAGSRSARATIWQTNSIERFDEGLPRERSLWKWVAAAGAAGGATGLVFLLRGSSQPGTWTPGSPVIGGPR